MTTTPTEFDDIRPFSAQELPHVFENLLNNPEFLKILQYIYPNTPIETVATKIKNCQTNEEVQWNICYPFLVQLVETYTTGCEINCDAIDLTQPYSFISNHRDIVLDSAFLNKLLMERHYLNTCEIAIGDNLLKLPWVKDLVRVFKSFIVKRNLASVRDQLKSSMQLSSYIHNTIDIRKQPIWIAQREGRAKDSNDRTQKSVLKMLTLGGKGTDIERLMALKIVPTSISYEYDPCDYLKAKEMQQKRDNPNWTKEKNEDNNSMLTGIMGFKGKVYYHLAPCINKWLENLPKDTPKTELFDVVANHIDNQIHCHYKLYPGNYVALDRLNDNRANSKHYTSEQETAFVDYINQQVNKIELPNKDTDFLRQQLLLMYANPTINYLRATNNV